MRRSLSPPMLVALLALLIAMGGDAIAGQVATIARKITNQDIKKGAVNSRSVKDGSLALKDFKTADRALLKGEKGEKGDAGVAGPKGETGARGPIGPRGATGTVDTSDFYDRTASDGRFVRGPGRVAATRFFLGQGIGTDEGLVFPGFGNVEANCTDTGARAQWRNASSGAQDVWESFDGGPAEHFSVAASGTRTSANASGAGDAARVEWEVGSGGYLDAHVARVVVDMRNVVGGCEYQTFAVFAQGTGTG